jgi:hypothetical protein
MRFRLRERGGYTRRNSLVILRVKTFFLQMGSIGESPPKTARGEETSHVKHENPAISSIRLFSTRVINFVLRIATAYTKGFVLSKNPCEREKRK